MRDGRARYRGAVGLSYYGYAPCCGAKLFGRSLAALEAREDEHRANCPNVASRARRPVQEELSLEESRV